MAAANARMADDGLRGVKAPANIFGSGIYTAPRFPILNPNPDISETCGNFNLSDYLTIGTATGVSAAFGYYYGAPVRTPMIKTAVSIGFTASDNMCCFSHACCPVDTWGGVGHISACRGFTSAHVAALSRDMR